MAEQREDTRSEYQKFEDRWRDELSMTQGWGGEVEQRFEDAKDTALAVIKEDYSEDTFVANIYTTSEIDEYLAEMVKEQLMAGGGGGYDRHAAKAFEDSVDRFMNYFDMPKYAHDMMMNGELHPVDVVMEAGNAPFWFWFFESDVEA